MQVYVAVRQFGYWAEGFSALTAAPNRARRSAGDVLRSAIGHVQAGPAHAATWRAPSPRVFGPCRPHPITAQVQGNAIGLALEEHPLIAADSEDTFEAGGVYSLRVGVSDERDHAIVSAMVAVHGHGSDVLWSSPGARDMTALEQLGSLCRGSGRAPSGAMRELVELHLIDTVAAWIASAPTAEGSSLLRFRTAMRETAGRRQGARSRDPLRAGADERDRRHPSALDDHAGRDRHSRRAHAGARRATKPDDVIAAILAGYEAMTRLGRAIDGPTMLYRGIWPTYFAAPFGIAAVAARLLELDAKQAANALALALTFAAPGVGHHNAATTLALARRRQCRPQRARRGAGGASRDSPPTSSCSTAIFSPASTA